MSLLALERASEDLHYASFETTTEDRGDHSFNGIFFALTCDAVAPVAACEVNSVAVRGDLGAMKVFYRISDAKRGLEAQDADTTERFGHYRADDQRVRVLLDASTWTKCYDADCGLGDFKTLVSLVFDEPVRFKPGEKLELYVHSADESDRGLVYDDAPDLCGRPEDDGMVQIWPGYAHLSSVPFGTSAPWYGDDERVITSLRRDRRFVGKVAYGVRWKLWEPNRETNASFPKPYRDVVRTILLGMKDRGSLLSALDYDVVMYMINRFVGWDWFGAELDEPVLPALEESSGSTCVDAAIRVFKDFHQQSSIGRARYTNDDVKYMAQIERVMNITSTVVSLSPDLRECLELAAPQIRMLALVHMTKNIFEHCRFDKNVNALKFARDMPTIQSITDRICTFIAHRQNWRHLERPTNSTGELEPCSDEEHAKALVDFLKTSNFMSLRQIFLMNHRNVQPGDFEDSDDDAEDGETDDDDDLDDPDFEDAVGDDEGADVIDEFDEFDEFDEDGDTDEDDELDGMDT